MRLAPKLLAAATLALLSAPASATPPAPVPLERRVADTELIVVARLVTQPVHCGDAYDVAVEETLKGEPPASPLRVRAPWYYTGCVHGPDQPTPKAAEAGARRALYFLGASRDGARDTTNVVTLDPDEGMSPWIWIGVFPRFGARFGPEAVRTLARLDDPAVDAPTGADLWVRGLEGSNPLLVHALLDRFRLVAGGPSQPGDTAASFGDAIVRRAQRDADAVPATETEPSTRARLLAAVIARCGDRVPPLRACALRGADAAWRAAAPQARVQFEQAVSEARSSARTDDSDVRWASLRFLVTCGDAEALPAVLDALKRRDDPTAHRYAVDLACELGASGGARRDPTIAAFVALLDDRSDDVAWVTDALRRMTGETFADAAAWRAWWAARKK